MAESARFIQLRWGFRPEMAEVMCLCSLFLKVWIGTFGWARPHGGLTSSSAGAALTGTGDGLWITPAGSLPTGWDIMLILLTGGWGWSTQAQLKSRAAVFILRTAF